MSNIFEPGVILSEPRIAIEHEGYHVPLPDANEPHPLWCVVGVHNRHVQLVAVSEQPVNDNGGLVLNPVRVITKGGHRLYVLMAFSIIRIKEELLPTPNYIFSPTDRVMPESLKEMMPHAKLYRPQGDPPDCNWPGVWFVRGLLWDRWDGGPKGKPELTARDVLDQLDDYSPAYRGDCEKEIIPGIRTWLEALIERHGPDYPVRYELPV